jgi:FKBP-type peptidyl-prolyl cis-trans isomerase
MVAAIGSGMQTTRVRSLTNMRSKTCVATLQTPQKPTTEPAAIPRRSALLAGIAALSLGSSAMLPSSTIAATETPTSPPQQQEPAISILSREEGTGTAAAQLGDLVLVHYVGRLQDGTVFDSTRGGLVSFFTFQ